MDALCEFGLNLFTLRGFWGIVYALVIVSVILLVVLENRNPIKAVGWVIILMLLPAVGLVAYFFFGRDNRRVRLMSKKAYQRIMSHATPDIPSSHIFRSVGAGRFATLSRLLHRHTGAPILEADSAEIFTHGEAKLSRMMEDIAAARSHVHIQYYVFSDDTTGRRVADLLARKVTEGVRVRVVYDYVGSWEASRSFFRKMRRAGVEVYPFLRVVFPLLTSKVNYRNHRKAVIIDGQIGYVGGMNIADRYTIGNHLGTWRDTHIRITGAAVNGLQASFIADWYVASQRILPINVYHPVKGSGSPVGEGGVEGAPMQFFQSGPTGPWRTLQQAYCMSIYNAKHSVWIETPYFLPNEPLFRAIVGAALSGVDVRLILPDKCDSRTVRMASDSFLSDLLEAGVKVFRYKAGFLHSKLLMVDDDLTILGSANMDFRSLEHNFELTGCVYDKAFTVRMRKVFEADMMASVPVLLKVWRKRPFVTRLSESVMRLLSPLL